MCICKYEILVKFSLAFVKTDSQISMQYIVKTLSKSVIMQWKYTECKEGFQNE